MWCVRCRKLTHRYGTLQCLTLPRYLIPRATPSQAMCHAISRHVLCHLSPRATQLWCLVVCSDEWQCIAYCTHNAEHTRPHHTSLRGTRFTATVIPISTHTHTRAMPSHARHLMPRETLSHKTCHAISSHVPCHLTPRIMPSQSACHPTHARHSHATCHAISRHLPGHLTLPSHARCHVISCHVLCHLISHATPSHATCHSISCTQFSRQ